MPLEKQTASVAWEKKNLQGWIRGNESERHGHRDWQWNVLMWRHCAQHLHTQKRERISHGSAAHPPTTTITISSTTTATFSADSQCTDRSVEGEVLRVLMIFLLGAFLQRIVAK